MTGWIPVLWSLCGDGPDSRATVLRSGNRWVDHLTLQGENDSVKKGLNSRFRVCLARQSGV